MNIFILDHNLKKCAEYHCNSHIIKQISEYCQILSTNIYLTTGHTVQAKDQELFYKLYPKCKHTIKPTHINHPCTVWVRKSKQNFEWLMRLLEELHKEWLYRYNHPKDKIHASYYKFINGYVEPNLPDIGMTSFALAMPDKYKNKCAVKAYRDYYIGDKQHLLKYKRREFPEWLSIIQN